MCVIILTHTWFKINHWSGYVVQTHIRKSETFLQNFKFTIKKKIFNKMGNNLTGL